MPEQLFYKYDLSGTTENSGRALADDINSLGENEVLGTSEQDMVAYLVEKQEIAPLTIADESGIQMDYSEVQIDVSRSREYPILGMGPSHVIGTRLTFYVPFTGDADLFHCRPSTRRMGLPAPSITSNELVFTYETTKGRASGVNDTFKEELEQTRIHAARVNEKVNQFNDALPEKARQLLNARRKKLLQDRSLVESIGFPIRRRQTPPSTFVVPDVKRHIKLPKPVASSTSFSPEPTLDTNEYEDILSILSNMVDVMERSPRAFKDLNEEDLRTHFLVQLNGQYEGQATGETFNYEGKTDILIRADDKNIFIAECKFWTGPAGLTKALDQLLGYTAWRDTKAALLVFNRRTNMSTVLERVPAAVRAHPNYKAERTTNSETEFRYVFGHRDDETREITVTILVFDVPA